MNILDTILSGPVVFGIIAAASLGLVARSFMSTLRQIPELRTQLAQMQLYLDEALDGIPETRKHISQLQEDLSPLKQKAQELQDYNTELMDVERRAVEKEKKKSHNDEIGMHKRSPT